MAGTVTGTVTGTVRAASTVPVGDPVKARSGRVVTAALAVFVTGLALFVADPMLPDVERGLGTGPGASRWVVLGYALGWIAALYPAGRWMSRRPDGPRRMVLAGAVGFAVATGLAAVAPGIAALIAARVVQGAFAGLLTAPVPLLALYGRRPATALAVTGVCGSLGCLTGTLASGGLVAPLGWRGILLALLPLVAVTALLGVRALPRFLPSPLPGRPSLRPLLAPLALATCEGTLITLYPFFLFQGEVQQAPLPLVGLVAVALPIGLLAAAVAGGRLSDRLNPRWAALGGVVVAAAGVSLTLPVSGGWSAPEVAVRLLVAGAGLGLACGGAQAVALRGLAAGAAWRVQAARVAGFTLGPILAASVWEASGYFSRNGLGTALLPCAATALLALAALVPIPTSRGEQ
ncbi:MFS transporter [Spongiactinospora sp. TRM90649]|uniref:MFS transporter n=1 Tax=Spongiactinospora sp. TRM90649 TaxID=3031114 RepID=UPI0023F82B49|nr:MFS transporter [Spongiactinospora sp. TRM90649]MDF5752443.1 MFS transporter [Spongiactinospora sp. TRM90649]